MREEENDVLPKFAATEGVSEDALVRGAPRARVCLVTCASMFGEWKRRPFRQQSSCRVR